MRTLLVSLFLMSSIVGCGGGGSSSSPPLSVQNCVSEQSAKNEWFNVSDGDVVLSQTCIDVEKPISADLELKTSSGKLIRVDFPKSYSKKLALELAEMAASMDSSSLSPEQTAKIWLENGDLAMRVNVRRPFYDVSISPYTKTWTNTVKDDFADIEFQAPVIFGPGSFVHLYFEIEIYNTNTGDKLKDPPSLKKEILLVVWDR